MCLHVPGQNWHLMQISTRWTFFPQSELDEMICTWLPELLDHCHSTDGKLRRSSILALFVGMADGLQPVQEIVASSMFCQMVRLLQLPPDDWSEKATPLTLLTKFCRSLCKLSGNIGCHSCYVCFLARTTWTIKNMSFRICSSSGRWKNRPQKPSQKHQWC